MTLNPVSYVFYGFRIIVVLLVEVGQVLALLQLEFVLCVHYGSG